MYYKTLRADGTTVYGYGKYPIPTTRSRWMPKIKGDLIACQNGYHLCREQDLIYHLSHIICPAEVGNRLIESDIEVITDTFRLHSPFKTWNIRTQRLFACDCAEYALNRTYDDPRSIESVRVARLFAEGRATAGERNLACSNAVAALASSDSLATALAVRIVDSYAPIVFVVDTAVGAVLAIDANVSHKWLTERLMYYLNGEKEN